MLEYVFGFLVGVITMYLAYRPLFKQFDKEIREKSGGKDETV